MNKFCLCSVLSFVVRRDLDLGVSRWRSKFCVQVKEFDGGLFVMMWGNGL